MDQLVCLIAVTSSHIRFCGISAINYPHERLPLETVRFLDVEDWAALVFGKSMLSKRRILFSASTGDTETA
ncbi:MAG: hypothetical protein V7K63_17630, partial [Nostoc sp.]